MFVDPYGEFWKEFLWALIEHLITGDVIPKAPTVLSQPTPTPSNREYIFSIVVPRWTEGMTQNQRQRFEAEIDRILQSEGPEFYPSWTDYSRIYIFIIENIK